MNINHLFKFIIILGIICALVFGGVYFYLRSQPKNIPVSLSSSKTSINEQDLISSMPEGLFLESNSKGIENLTDQSLDGQNQKTIRYISSQSFDKTIQFFEDYFSKNKWTMVQDGGDNKTLKLLTYQGDNSNAIIIIQETPDYIVVDLTIETKI